VEWSWTKESVNWPPIPPDAVLLVLPWDCMQDAPKLFWENLEAVLNITDGRKWFVVVNKADLYYEDPEECRHFLIDECKPPVLPQSISDFFDAHKDKLQLIEGLEVMWCYCQRWKDHQWELTEKMKARSLALLYYILHELHEFQRFSSTIF